MILNSSHSCVERSSPGVWLVMDEIDRMCGRDTEKRGKLRQIAEGVAAFMRESGRVRGDESSHLRVLVSRALFGAGEEEMARGLLLFGGGLVRRSNSLVAGGPLWVLDLGKLAVRENERGDMFLMTGLSAILESLAPVWDETAGRGVLGLDKVGSIARMVAGPAARRKQVAAVADDIRSFCRRKLSVLMSRRRWREHPLVMEMYGG